MLRELSARQSFNRTVESVVVPIPRISKKSWLVEYAFFLDEQGRISYTLTCRRCRRSCKQSWRARVLYCPIRIPVPGNREHGP